MADDVIKAEAAALHSLLAAVTHYAQQVRGAMDATRRDADALVKRSEEVTRRRTNDLNRALADVQQAQARLSGCRDEQQVAALRAEVASLRRYADERKQLHGYAQQALKTARDTQSSLIKTIQALDATVGEHTSVATKGLADIAKKLKEIGFESFGAQVGNRIRHSMTVLEVAHVIANGGHGLPTPSFIAPPTPPASIVKQAEDNVRRSEEELAEWDNLQNERLRDKKDEVRP